MAWTASRSWTKGLRAGEKVQVGIKKNIAFRMSKDLKFRINSNTSPAEIDKKIEMMYDNKKK